VFVAAPPSSDRWQEPPSDALGELRAAVLELEPCGLALLTGEPPVVRLANRAFREASDEPPEGRGVEELWPSEAGLALRATLERVRATGEPARFERLEVGGPGAMRRFACHAQRLTAGGAPSLLLALWETTEVEDARAQAERSRERAELLASVASELNAGASLDAVLRTTLQRAAALLGAEDGAIWLLEPGEVLSNAAELLPRGRVGARRGLEGWDVTAAVLRDRAARLFGRADGGPAERAWLQAQGMEAALAVPILEEGRGAGVLYLKYGTRFFLPAAHDVAFAEAIAAQCALALGRARVFDAERAARARAEAAEHEARRAERLQEQLAAVVGHDLRTPLQAIALGAAVLEKRGALAEDDRRTLTRIAASAAKMERIIGDLLDFARVRSRDGIPVAFAPARLDEVVRAAADEIAAAGGDEVAVAVQGDTALEGDASRLGQLASNLFGYALRERPAEARVRAEVRGGDAEVTLTVVAPGLHLVGETVPQLFEPFRRTSGDSLRGSLGLGLFTARAIARAHGGEVRVLSDEEGTRLVATLPRRPRVPPLRPLL
jgi:signal transduction histidine kinase